MLALATSLAQAQASGPVHVVIDATGLKVHGVGELLVKKHGEGGMWTWRKLHPPVNPSTGEILASELTSNEEGDASQVGRLLEQLPGTLALVTGDGGYDGERIYQAVAERQPDLPVAVVIPPRSTVVPSAAVGTTPSQRDPQIQMIEDQRRMGRQKRRAMKRRSHAGTARRMLAGYQAIAMIRKGQIHDIGGRDMAAQAAFIAALLEVAA